MHDTYEAILRGDRLEWSGDAPDQARGGRPIAVRVTVLGKPTSEGNDRGRRMAEVLDLLATSQALPGLSDPMAWEREARRDRSLPDRNE